MVWVSGADLTNRSGMEGLLKFAMSASNGLIGIYTLIAIFIITFATMTRNNADHSSAFAASLFITFVFSVLLYIIDWVTQSVVLLVLILAVIGMIVLYVPRR